MKVFPPTFVSYKVIAAFPESCVFALNLLDTCLNPPLKGILKYPHRDSSGSLSSANTTVADNTSMSSREGLVLDDVSDVSTEVLSESGESFNVPAKETEFLPSPNAKGHNVFFGEDLIESVDNYANLYPELFRKDPTLISPTYFRSDFFCDELNYVGADVTESKDVVPPQLRVAEEPLLRTPFQRSRSQSHNLSDFMTQSNIAIAPPPAPILPQAELALGKLVSAYKEFAKNHPGTDLSSRDLLTNVSTMAKTADGLTQLVALSDPTIGDILHTKGLSLTTDDQDNARKWLAAVVKIGKGGGLGETQLNQSRAISFDSMRTAITNILFHSPSQKTFIFDLNLIANTVEGYKTILMTPSYSELFHEDCESTLLDTPEMRVQFLHAVSQIVRMKSESTTALIRQKGFQSTLATVVTLLTSLDRKADEIAPILDTIRAKSSTLNTILTETFGCF
ncbi:hypothetical protein HOH87_07515 [bacterium]|jgi:hypothetical protein|nr:hypothetical protein [bacterium]